MAEEWSAQASAAAEELVTQSRDGRYYLLKGLYDRLWTLQDQRDKLTFTLEEDKRGIKYLISVMRAKVPRQNVRPDLRILSDEVIVALLTEVYERFGKFPNEDVMPIRWYSDNGTDGAIYEQRALFPLLDTQRQTVRLLADIERSIKQVEAQIADLSKLLNTN
jgi:hypothetical protein